MVALGQMRSRDRVNWEVEAPIPVREQARPGWVNVGEGERAVSVAAGAILAIFGIARRSLPGLVVAGAGGALLYRGITGHSPTYQALGMDTAQGDQAIHVEQAFLINRTPEELYQYWRNFENLPRIMTHLKSVQVLEGDGRRSHWVASAPRIAGGSVAWDAEITTDEPNSRIAWRSLPGSQVENAGEIRFAEALGDRGTEVHVFLDYMPPAGRLGHWLATAFGQSPQRQMKEDLRNFKRLMETGEIPTIEGQPHGTCTGAGAGMASFGSRFLGGGK